MKKLTVISALMIVLALIVVGCSPQSAPTTGPAGPQPGSVLPQGPQPGNPQPGGPQPGNPQPGGPQPGGPQPGGPQPDGPQPGGPQPGGPQPGGPKPTNPLPPQPTPKLPSPTVKTGGGTGPVATPTTDLPQIKTAVPAQTNIFDIGLVNIFGNTVTGNIMATIKNEGNVDVDANIEMECWGDWRTCDVCEYAIADTSFHVQLTPGSIVNVDTGLDLNSAITHQSVGCLLTSASISDSNLSNSIYGPVTVK